VLHAGAHRHGVELLESGRRRNLILWLQSSAWRAERAAAAEPCPPWCGSSSRGTAS
jgi:hypothetical protein